jgi:serine/threonine-protein kinase
LVAGKYRIERVLNQIGLLCAVQVRHAVLETQATLKYLLPESRAFPEAVSNFLRGARLLSQLRTEHVAAVMDVGMLDIGTPYLVLAQPEGPDIAQVIRVRGALPLAEAQLYVKQICQGLAQAHALGLVHGALRPSNVVLTKRQDGFPIACITDFGNPEGFDFDELTRTDSGLRTHREVLDAIRYLSPDHARNPDTLDARCDVWAVGTIFFELLTGEPAFAAKTPAGLLASIAADELPPIRTLRHDAPEALEGIVRCCLSKAREARFANGSQLLRALEVGHDDLAESTRPTRSSVETSGDIATTPVASAPEAVSTQPRAATEQTAPIAAQEQPGFLREEPQRKPASRGSGLAIAAGLLVGGLGFWTVKVNTPEKLAPQAASTLADVVAPVSNVSAVNAASPIVAPATAPAPVAPEVSVPAAPPLTPTSAVEGPPSTPIAPQKNLPLVAKIQQPRSNTSQVQLAKTPVQAAVTSPATRASDSPTQGAPAAGDDPFGSF